MSDGGGVKKNKVTMTLVSGIEVSCTILVPSKYCSYVVVLRLN
jgi:hypothetical protein